MRASLTPAVVAAAAAEAASRPRSILQRCCCSSAFSSLSLPLPLCQSLSLSLSLYPIYSSRRRRHCTMRACTRVYVNALLYRARARESNCNNITAQQHTQSTTSLLARSPHTEPAPPPIARTDVTPRGEEVRR